MSETLLHNLNQEGLRGRLIPKAKLADVTWFRVGGPADMLFQPADTDDLALFLARLDPQIPITVVGLGSNLLVRDGGISGVVIRLSAKGFGSVEQVSETKLKAGCSVPDKKLAYAALKAGVGGFAFYHGIPGSIGGALRMNAGANGTETCDRVIEVTAVDRSGAVHRLTNADMDYAYRHSGASKDLIFTEALFEGPRQPVDQIQADMDAVTEHREKAQPIRDKTGGSTFKNPPNTSAWKEVDKAGCRGLIIGDAQVSEKHCNFLINRGAATAYDLELLGETVRSRVLATSGIELEWEIKRLGRFDTGRDVEPFLGAKHQP